MTAFAGDTRRPLIVEVIGPAGAGKSTICTILRLHDRTLGPSRPRIATHEYCKDVFPLLPTFLWLHIPYRGVLSKEVKRMLHLHTLHRVLVRERPLPYSALVLDEGPLYMLARMKTLCRTAPDAAAFGRWWRQTIVRWARALNAIVCLDAPDMVLAERIRARHSPPPLADTSDESLLPFLANYRASYRSVIAQLVAAGGPQPILFATDRQPMEGIAADVLSLVNRELTATIHPDASWHA